MEEQAITNALLTDKIKNDLKATKPWVKLIAIFLFVSIGIMFIASAVMVITSLNMPDETSRIPLFGTAAVYILMGILYFFPGFYLLKYASSIGTLLKDNSVSSLETAIGYQKSFWKFIGWMTLVSFVITLLGIVLAIFIPMLMR